MDFGAAVGFDGLLGSDLDARQRPYGTGLFKQLGRLPPDDADEWRLINSGGGNKGSAKVAKSSHDCSSVSAPMAAVAAAALPTRRSGSNGLSSDSQQNQHMLCFSSSSSSSPLHKSEPHSLALPCFSYASSVYSNYAGFSSGGLSGGNIPGMVLGGGRGPFTPSQWMELEHQALIYKYINANIPVPSNLLIPIRKAFDSAGFCYASGFPLPNSRGWRSFQLGFSNSTDPEPGRCRRTDGKKWRCSREAVADQKYCERHMNRGRHRSRKPVEGLHSGHPVPGGTTSANTAATFSTITALSSAVTKGLPVMSVVPGSGASESSFSHFQSGDLSLSADSSMNRFFMDTENPSEKIQNLSSGFSIVSPSTKLKSPATPCLINSSLHWTSLLSNSCRDLGILKDRTDRQAESNHSIHQFMSDWSEMKVQSSDTTHLSISTPMASSDDKVTLWPLRSASEPDQAHRQTMNWIPISRETSMGGPLGEVLHSANNSSSSTTECKNSSALNLVSGGWEGSFSSGLRSSPTGVLQKTAFSSVSNSSAGSSPRIEENRSKLVEGAAMSGDL